MFCIRNRHASSMLLASISLFVAGSICFAQDDFKKPVTDSETRLKWHRQHLEMQEKSEYAASNWRHIGPEIMSGRVTDIAVPGNRPFTFFVSTASGGVWKTENEGTTWTPIFDDAPSGSVGAICVAPSKPNVVWVGLGESNIFRSSMSITKSSSSTPVRKRRWARPTANNFWPNTC